MYNQRTDGMLGLKQRVAVCHNQSRSRSRMAFDSLSILRNLLVRRKILRLYLGYQRKVARCLHVWDGAGEGGSAEER